MDIENIDIETLRKDLIDYFTAAYVIVSPLALMDITDVEYASDEKLIQIALQNGFNLDDYAIKRGR